MNGSTPITYQGDQFAAALRKLQPRIGNYAIHRILLRWRSRKHGGQFPARMWELLKHRLASSRRPLFIGRTSDAVRYVGDFRQVYPVVQLADPTFQSDLAAWIADHLRRRNTGAYIDVGANIGILAGSVAALVPDRAVIAFEPISDTALQAAATFELNKLRNVVLWQAAVSDTEGEVGMSVPDGEADQAAIRVSDPLGVLGPLQRVHAVTLDQLAGTGSIPAPAVVKIDVEGHEPEAIRGMISLLRRERPLLIFEYLRRSTWCLDEVIELLRGAGYTRFGVLGPGCNLIPLPIGPGEIFNIACE